MVKNSKPSNKMLLTKVIKKKARAIGFDLVGITSAEPFFSVRAHLEDRTLSDFISQDKKLLTTPGLHLPGAKSIVSLALSYASSKKFNEDNYIALYARGQDYHDVIKKKLLLLMNSIKRTCPDVKMISYTDTGPILEREVARRAGLGWIGKNNNLINPEYGSYLFLAEIILDIELQYDQAIEYDCGSCNLCIEKCPGKALEKPYFLAYENCISYLTQKKGFLDENQLNKIGNNLWGCDICLRVCPYNRDIPVNLHSEFQPILKGDYKKILGFKKNNICKEWEKAALFWRGLRILKRNTLINIGNTGNNEYIPLLLKELDDPSPIIRTYSVWALGKINTGFAKSILYEQMKREKNNKVIEEILKIINN